MEQKSGRKKHVVLTYLKWILAIGVIIVLVVSVIGSFALYLQISRSISAPAFKKIRNFEQIKKENENKNLPKADNNPGHEVKITITNRSDNDSTDVLSSEMITSGSISLDPHTFIPMDQSGNAAKAAEEINTAYSELLCNFTNYYLEIKKQNPDINLILTLSRKIMNDDTFITIRLRQCFDLSWQEKWNETYLGLCAAENDKGAILLHCQFVEQRFNNWDIIVHEAQKDGSFKGVVNLGCRFVNFQAGKMKFNSNFNNTSYQRNQ